MAIKLSRTNLMKGEENKFFKCNINCNAVMLKRIPGKTKGIM